eukprot:TRINITY_DN4383_c0_g1_i1.p2 TRINITY_DN4383_c0_g1~~TRINITY_DN4383_c0_g1_i1.p2  ORF type:complete len:294 (+),score=56.73 TRINITY_DN4383_c0_g1_i1:1385-2266(+)
MRLWDLEKGTNIKTVAGHNGVIFCLYYDKERNIAVTGGQDKTIKMWDLNASNSSKDGLIATLPGHTDRLCCLQYDGDANLIISGSSDSIVKIWDTRMVGQRTTTAGATPTTNCLDTQPQQKRDANDASCMRSWKGHSGRICSLQFDHEKLVTGSDDHKIKVWSLYDSSSPYGSGRGRYCGTAPDCWATLADHDYWVNSLQFSDSKLVSGAADDTIKVWDFTSTASRKKASSTTSSSGSGISSRAGTSGAARYGSKGSKSWLTAAAGLVGTAAASGGNLGMPIPSARTAACTMQ